MGLIALRDCPGAASKLRQILLSMLFASNLARQRDTAKVILFSALKHLFVGALMVVIGCFGVNRDAAFVATSVPAQLIVLQVDTGRNTEGKFKHRMTLGLVTDARPRPEYTGGIWTGIAMHRAGDVVAGRYDAESGEMRSDRMLMIWGWIARLAQFLGVVAVVQGVLILFGWPELLLPLRVRVGR
jgi:hypothetical protein